MKIIHSIAELRATLAHYKKPVLVPTMGNLHEGHIALVKQGKALGDVLITYIFVNRLQFQPHEDFDKYPRTFESDCEKLRAAGCDIVFAPDEKEMYPEPQGYKVHPPPGLADLLEGAFRPGFYVGVCTVLMKFFWAVQPRVAIFGRKDYQQLMVVRNMVKQFAMPIEIVAGDTVRADDGLALSSRNGYLTAEERIESKRLNAVLRSAAEKVASGGSVAAAEEDAMTHLRAHHWKPDYVVIRRRDDLSEIAANENAATLQGKLVALAAARLGNTRLIDQWEF